MEKIGMGSHIVKKSDYLCGIKYWVQWLPIGYKPRFEVFIYAGTQLDIGIHWFHSRRDPKIFISKNVYQLNNHGFYPFVLDIKRIDAYCEEQGFRPPDQGA